MSEEKEPKKQRKATAAAPPTEHKEPWQAKYATPAEIQQMVSRRVLLRYNEVRHRAEVHWLSQGPVIREDEQGLLTIFGGDGGVTDGVPSVPLLPGAPAAVDAGAGRRHHGPVADGQRAG